MYGPGRCRYPLVFACAVVAALALAFPATGQGRFRIHQAFLGEPPKATFFLEVFDGAETSPAPVDGDHLRFFCEGRPLPLLASSPLEGSGEGTAFIFLVDISKSLREPQMRLMREALSRFVEKMGPADWGALLSFGDEVRLLADFTADRQRLLREIDALRLSDMTTNLHRGLVRTQELARRLDEGLPRRRVAIVLSDGKNEAVGGETREEVLDSLRRDGIPLFALGFYAPPLEPMRPHLEWLRRFAEVSGGEYFPPDGTPLGDILKELQRRLGLVWHADVDLSSLPFDGREVEVEARLAWRGEVLTDRIRLRLWPSSSSPGKVTEPSSAPQSEMKGESERAASTPRWPFFLLPLLLLVALVLLFSLRRRGSFKASPFDRTGPLELIIEINREGHLEDVFSLSLADKTTLGRSGDSGICIKGDPALSGLHCELFLSQGRLYVRDLHSTNGTYLNGRRLSADAVPVAAGDELLLGRTTVRLRRIGRENAPA